MVDDSHAAYGLHQGISEREVALMFVVCCRSLQYSVARLRPRSDEAVVVCLLRFDFCAYSSSIVR